MTISRTWMRVLAVASTLAIAAGACSSAATPSTSTTAPTTAPSGSSTSGYVPLSSGPVHLVMWEQWGGSGPNAEAMKAMIKAYEDSHPGVTIDDVSIAGTDNAKILTAMSGGKPPFDILDMGLGLYLGSWAAKGALMPLDDFIARSKLDTSLYVDSMWKAMQVNGKQYALPFMGFLTGLIYNKALFQAAGLDPNKPPTTTEELAQYAEKLTKVGPNGQDRAARLPAGVPRRGKRSGLHA